MREGLQILGPDWHYLYVNEALARHGRKAREELLGRTMLECYPGIEDTAVFAVMKSCLEERRSTSLENEFVYADGERAWFELRIQPCREGLLVLSLDITERKRLEATVQQSLKPVGRVRLGGGGGHRHRDAPGDRGARLRAIFTTKGDSGTGLGLAMVYSMVTRHDGTVQIRTTPGKGTTITLAFPRA
jgi:PAS domain S-box-containing protein